MPLKESAQAAAEEINQLIDDVPVRPMDREVSAIIERNYASVLQAEWQRGWDECNEHTASIVESQVAGRMREIEALGFNAGLEKQNGLLQAENAKLLVALRVHALLHHNPQASNARISCMHCNMNPPWRPGEPEIHTANCLVAPKEPQNED